MDTPTIDSADIVARALAEDLGSGDVTTLATVPADARAEAVIRQKAPGVIYGLDVAEQVFRSLDPEATFTREVAEGEWRESGDVLRVEGLARADRDMQLLHDGAPDQRWIGERLERNKRHAVRELVRHRAGRGEGEGCLTDPTRPRQRYKSDIRLTEQ